MSIYVSWRAILGASVGAVVGSYVPGWRVAAPVISGVVGTLIGSFAGIRGCVHKWFFRDREVLLLKRNDQLYYRVYIVAFNILRIPNSLNFIAISRQHPSGTIIPIDVAIKEILKCDPVWSKRDRNPTVGAFDHWHGRAVTFVPPKILYEWEEGDASVIANAISCKNVSLVQMTEYNSQPMLRVFNQAATWYLPLDDETYLKMSVKLKKDPLDVNDKLNDICRSIQSFSKYSWESLCERDRQYVRCLLNIDHLLKNNPFLAKKIIDENDKREEENKVKLCLPYEVLGFDESMKAHDIERMHAFTYLKDCNIRVLFNPITLRILKVELQLLRFKSAFDNKVEINHLQPAVTVIRSQITNQLRLVVEEAWGKRLFTNLFYLKETDDPSEWQVESERKDFVQKMDFDRSITRTWNITRETFLFFKRHMNANRRVERSSSDRDTPDHLEWIRKMLGHMSSREIEDELPAAGYGEDVRKRRGSSCCIA